MRDHRTLALLLLLAARPLPGQDLQRLENHADSLLLAWRGARAVAEIVDSLERIRAGAGRDTIAVGALRIVTNTSPLPVHEAAALAWPVIDSVYGIDAQSVVQ